MMYRKRIGIWMIFVVACLVFQMIVPLIPSMAINFKQALLDRELENMIQEFHKVDEEVDSDTTVNDVGAVDDPENVDRENVEEAFGVIVDIVLTTSRYVGILIIVFGIFSVVMGFRNENAEAMSNAVRLIVAGSVLVGVDAIVPTLFTTTGVG